MQTKPQATNTVAGDSDTSVIGTTPAPVACDSRSTFAAPDEPAEYRTCDNCGITYRRELTSHFDDSSAGETTQCWSCLGYDGIDEQAMECVEVVDHPGEMGPHQDAFCAGCGTLGRADEMDSDGECERCGYLGPGYTSRGDAHLMAVTAPGAR